MTEQTPRKGDKVRVTFVAEFLATDETFSVVDVADGMGPIRLQIPVWATVEVLERAEHASRDLTGTVRQDPKTGRTAQRVDRSDAPWMEYTLDFTDYEWLEDSDVRDWPVIGSAPGTPAAEADPTQMLIKMGKAMRQIGETDEAYMARLKREGLWQEPTVSGPPEAEEGERGLCMLDDCVAAPRCSSGATVWHNRTDECGLPKPEARVFRADGPEPPAGVDKLEPSEPLRGWTHIQRDGRWWRWVNENGRAFSSQEWSLLPSNVEFREVV